MKSTRAACQLTLGLLFWLSCGGSVQTADNGSTGAGTGGAGTGGAQGGTGGGTGGTGVSTGGSAGTGVLPDICKLPRDSGPCEAAFQAFWHNPESGLCEPFIYGGCQGNANRFETFEACQAACQGGTPDWDLCTRPTDCTIVPSGCCGGCDPAIRQTYIAINRSNVGDHSKQHHCENVDCAACMELPPLERTRQYFLPACTNGRCAIVDVRETELVSCGNDTDCMLRVGAECCERCSSHSLVSLNKNAKLGDLVCGPDAPACPPCAPMIPPGYVATCQGGQCRVTAGPTL